MLGSLSALTPVPNFAAPQAEFSGAGHQDTWTPRSRGPRPSPWLYEVFPPLGGGG